MEQEIKDLIEVSRYYGGQKAYVIAGGGNTSYKNENHLWIKASGINLSTIDETGFCVLDRQKLAEIPEMEFSSDPVKREEEVKDVLMASRIDPSSGLRPSVETSLHNLFNYSYVVHTHSTLVNGLLCSNLAEQKSKEIFGDKVLYLPYADPGLVLFKVTEQKIREYNLKFHHDPQVVLIQNHGIFVAADSTDEIKGIYAGIEAKLKALLKSFPVLKTLLLQIK
jgi:rhamnose utilization protein RhaD (predicted bifunctional aldolase and dehydrogenase)